MYPDDFNFSGYLKARVLTGDIVFLPWWMR